MGEITRQPARAIQNALIDSVLAGLCALIVFGPIVGVVLKGYGFTLAPARVAILVAVVMAGRLALSLLLQSHRGKAFIARFEGADDGVYVRPPGYRSRLRWIIPLLVGLAIVFPFLATKYLLTVAILGLIYVLLGLGLNIVVGLAGLLDLGYVAFYAIGAYGLALGYQYLGLGFWAMLPLGAVMAALAGALLGFPVLRMHGDYLAIVTLAFGEIVRALLRLIQPIGGARGMIGIPNYANFFWIMLFVVLTLWLLRNLIYSPYGRAFIAIRDNEIAADAMGINTTKYKIMSFCIAAFIAGVAGGLYAHVLSFIQPDSFSFTKSSDFLVYLYAGGSGSLTGSVIGAVLLTILPEVLRFLADWRLVLYALILVVVMLYRSEGLCGGKEVPFLRIKRSSLYEQPLFGRKKNDTSKK